MKIPFSRPARAAAGLVAAAILVLAGCGGGSDPAGGGDGGDGPEFTKTPTGALRAGGFEETRDVGKARLDNAKSSLGQVQITLDQTSFDAQKLTTRLASGDVPDVVQMDRSFVATYAAQDLIIPLDKCFAAWGIDPAQYFYPAVIGDVTWRDQRWAVPQFFQPSAIMLNTEVLSAAGVDPDQLDTSKPEQVVAAAQKMYAADGGKPTRLGFDPVPTGAAPLWILGSGGRLVADDGKPTLDDPANVEAITRVKALTDAQGGFAKLKSFSDSFDFFGKNNQFVKSQVGAQLDAQWDVNVLSPYAESIKLGAVPFRGPDGQPVATSGGSSFVIPAKAANPNAACGWMINTVTEQAWMAAADARAATLKKTPGAINTGLFTGAPSADTAIRTKYVKSSGNAGFDQTITTFYDVVANGRSVGASPAGQTISTELNNAMTSALLGQKSPQQALADAQAAAMRAYDKVAG